MRHYLSLTIVTVLAIFVATCGGDGIDRSLRTYNIAGQELKCRADKNGYMPTLCVVASITNRSMRTPKGAAVWVQDGAVVTPDEMQQMDEGLQRSFDKSQCEGYGRILGPALRHDQYIIAVLKATSIDRDGNPEYRLPCAQYCHGEFDKGGFITVAAEMAAVGIPFGNILVYPDHSTNLTRVSNLVEYEAEHVILSYYDGTRFERTLTHGNGQGHPIWSCRLSAFGPQRSLLIPSQPTTLFENNERRVIVK